MAQWVIVDARMKNKDALINLTKEIENPDHADENLNVQLFMRILREEVVR